MNHPNLPKISSESGKVGALTALVRSDRTSGAIFNHFFEDEGLGSKTPYSVSKAEAAPGSREDSETEVH